MSIFTDREKTIIRFLAGILLLGSAVTVYRHYWGDSLPKPTIDLDLLEEKTALARKKLAETQPAEKEQIQFSKFININKSNKAELMSVPGIGPVMAERILQFRSDFGPFSSIEDLKQVKGIGDKKFEKIKQYLTIKD